MRPSSSTLPGASTPVRPRSSGDRRVRAERRQTSPVDAAAPRRLHPTSREVFFSALSACGINGETARLVCSDPAGKPIDSGTWSRLKNGDPDDPKTPHLTDEHVDRALAELGDAFCLEYSRRWQVAFRSETREEAEAALVDAVNFALAILDKLAAAQLAGKVA